MADLPASADVVVIGGGATGASTAFHLARVGVRDVLLLERDGIAAGSTGKAVGGFRVQFGDELNIRVNLRSLEAFRAFGATMAELGVDADIALRQPGYLIVLSEEAHLGFFREAIALQNRLGVPTREVTPEEIAAIVPQLRTDDLVGGSFGPLDGRFLPEAVAQGYASGAARLGARVAIGVEATAIRHASGRVTAVETTRGTVATDTVVLAGGVWSVPLAAQVGLDLPVRGDRHWVCFAEDDGGLADDLPFVSDYAAGFYVTREPHGLVFGGKSPELEDVGPPAIHRLPLMERLPVASTWWGFYDMSPDNNAIVDEAPEVGRVLVATGFSGHGVMQSPAVGEHLAERIAGRAPSLDLGGFALARFSDPERPTERFVL